MTRIFCFDWICGGGGSMASAAIGDSPLRISTETLWVESTFAKDIRGAHDGILYVGTGLPFEAESVFEVEGYHRCFGVLQHKKAERSGSDLRSYFRTLGV